MREFTELEKNLRKARDEFVHQDIHKIYMYSFVQFWLAWYICTDLVQSISTSRLVQVPVHHADSNVHIAVPRQHCHGVEPRQGKFKRSCPFIPFKFNIFFIMYEKPQKSFF